MFKILIILLLVITTFLPITSVEAVEVKDLYEASVTINSRNTADRANALKKALSSVMVKVGGKKSVLENKIIKGSLKDYQLYLHQYRYQLETKTTLELSGANQTQSEELFLIASFNEDRINQLFQKADLPIWGRLRPQILLWLVDENGFTRSITPSSPATKLPSVVNDFSSERGLPIMMPLMDLTDTTRIELSDIWGRFEQPVSAVSSRYSPEAIVVMRISNSSLLPPNSQSNIDRDSQNCGLLCDKKVIQENEYVLDWSLLSWNQKGNQKNLSQQYQGNDKNILLEQGLNDISQLLYQYYALTTNSNNDFTIEVVNVDSLSSYVDVFEFLTNLSSVKSVTLVKAEGDSRRFSLQLLGSVDAFVASLALNTQLKQLVDPLARYETLSVNNETSDTPAPVFYWNN